MPPVPALDENPDPGLPPTHPCRDELLPQRESSLLTMTGNLPSLVLLWKRFQLMLAVSLVKWAVRALWFRCFATVQLYTSTHSTARQHHFRQAKHVIIDPCCECCGHTSLLLLCLEAILFASHSKLHWGGAVSLVHSCDIWIVVRVLVTSH